MSELNIAQKTLRIMRALHGPFAQFFYCGNLLLAGVDAQVGVAANLIFSGESFEDCKN